MPSDTATTQNSPSKNVKNLSIDTELIKRSSSTNNLDKLTMVHSNSKESESNIAQPTPVSSSEANNTTSTASSGIFKVPKKILVYDNKDATRLPSSSATGTNILEQPPTLSVSMNNSSATVNSASSTKLNKNIISNLNKSLKAKQKIISSKEPHPKNSVIISDIINTSPQSSVFPNSLSAIADNETENASVTSNNVVPNIANSTTASTTNSDSTNKPSSIRGKHKRIVKQNSTRTDFFAAKLASAVDDVESSDSDETFVYENNLNEYDNLSATNNPTTLSTQNDNVSVTGSVNNAVTTTVNSPSIADVGKNEEISVNNSHNIAESIQSAYLAKVPNFKHTSNSTPPANNKISNTSINNSISSNYLESAMNKEKAPSRQRSLSSIPHNPNEDSSKLQISNQSFEKTNTVSSNHSPLSPFNELSQPLRNTGSHGLGILDNRNNYNSNNNNTPQPSHSIHDGYNDDHYSYDEVDDDNIIDDDLSTEGDFFSSSQRNVGSSNTTVPIHNTGNVIYSNSNNNEPHVDLQSVGHQNQNNSVTSKNTSKKNYKSSTTSSKLRSTTSKLFDKKGSQPRRYSIIPDDIDIEDFDDELIYYDNNIRFPYNNSNSNSNFNESSPLLNQGHRIPHYRSLNLNFQGAKRAPSNLKSKRYLSTGQPLMMTNNGNNNINAPPNNANSDIFPFPYPEPHQNYYYDFDEYDEESQINGLSNDNDLQVHRTNSRNLSGCYNNHPHLTSNNGHFLLPRKKSDHEFRYHRINCIKSFIYTLISITGILAVGFIMGFVLATTKDLTNVSIIGIENPIVSQDELVFNIVVEAFNPGWFTVCVDEVELDLFAKSGYLPDATAKGNAQISNTVETILLGTVFNLESSMTFSGGFFSREPIKQIGEIRLLSPGKNLTNFNSFVNDDGNSTEPDNSKKWEMISKNPFDLIIRGILKYNLPMSKNTKSVVVNKIGYIDPTQLQDFSKIE